MNISVGTAIKYSRDLHQFGLSEEFGAIRAHDDLLESLLREEVACSVFLFMLHLQSPIVHDDSSVRLLRGRFPSKRIEIEPIGALPQRATENDLIFVGSAPDVNALCHCRLTLGYHAFPISSFLHSLVRPTMLECLGLVRTMQPYDCIVSPSKAGARAIEHRLDMVRELLPTGQRCKARIAVVPYGFDPHLGKIIDKEIARAMLRIPIDACVLCYIGRFSSGYKADLEPLLIATKILLDSRRSVFLTLGGQDKHEGYVAHLLAVVDALGMRDRVSIIPNFPAVMKGVILSAADIFVSPVDNIQETFGLALLDAMAFGLPVVASDWSGYREIVRDGITGFLVPTYWRSEYANAISAIDPLCEETEKARYLSPRTVVDVEALRATLTQLIDDCSLRNRMGEEGKKIALQEYSWTVAVKTLKNLWEDQFSEFRRLSSCCLMREDWGDLSRIFGHYASREINDDTKCRLSADGLRHAGPLLAKCAIQDRERYSRLIESIGDAEWRWADLTDGSVQMQGALLWLAKRGIVALR